MRCDDGRKTTTRAALGEGIYDPPNSKEEAFSQCSTAIERLVSDGKKKKNSFEEYTINTPNEYLSPIFPLPAQRASIRLHKKHAGKGVAVSKAPADALPPNLCTGYPGLKLLHLDPLVLSVDNFFTADECDAYLALREHECSHKLEQSATFSAATNSARTSTTWFVRYQEATALLARAR